jgi:hypothetical protein
MSRVSLVIFLLLAAGRLPALADADDQKWVRHCVSDNRDEGQTAYVVETYCTCMTDKMPSSATQSVSAWEKTHFEEQEACSKEAGWNSGRRR